MPAIPACPLFPFRLWLRHSAKAKSVLTFFMDEAFRVLLPWGVPAFVPFPLSCCFIGGWVRTFKTPSAGDNVNFI